MICRSETAGISFGNCRLAPNAMSKLPPRLTLLNESQQISKFRASETAGALYVLPGSFADCVLLVKNQDLMHVGTPCRQLGTSAAVAHMSQSSSKAITRA